MTVADLIRKLQEQDPGAQVEVRVGWANDTACSDDGEDVDVLKEEERVVLSGWMSNCATTLEFADDAEENGA